MKRFPILLIVILMLVYSCKKSNTSNTTNSVYTPSCSGTKSFSTDVWPLISSKCNTSGCHVNLTNYAQVKSAASSIRSKIADGSMPKNSTLTNAQKDMIMCWIDAGAPNN